VGPSDPTLFFASQAAWEKWLAEEHAKSTGLWLKLAKKDSGIESVNYAQALDVALCFGWIDGQKDKLDGEYWLQRFTPRRPRSGWSKINCAKAEALIAEGRMRPPGLREIERAKADGRWASAYASQSKATVPADLEQALEKNPKARKAFGGLDSANRFAILYRVHTAKKAETRSRRIGDLVQMLSEGRTVHPRPKGRS
jgi:uncharacterized protein YdeI (YjbR/CyaY-like superfamily)